MLAQHELHSLPTLSPPVSHAILSPSSGWGNIILELCLKLRGEGARRLTAERVRVGLGECGRRLRQHALGGSRQASAREKSL